MKDFKDFIMRGNVMDLAVGMIVGAAFTAIITSLVDDILNPIIGLFAGKLDFSQLFITLDGKHYDTLKAAEDAGAAVLKYGSFISAVINFLIVAFVVFMLIKAINRLVAKFEKPEEPAAPTTKVCPYCKSEIAIEATRCPHCTSKLEETAAEAQ